MTFRIAVTKLAVTKLAVIDITATREETISDIWGKGAVVILVVLRSL